MPLPIFELLVTFLIAVFITQFFRVQKKIEDCRALTNAIREEADAFREERAKTLKTLHELIAKRFPSLICPLTKEIMRDPQTAADGYSYEGAAIRSWFASGHTTSPVSNLNLPHFDLIPNNALRSIIQYYLGVTSDFSC